MSFNTKEICLDVHHRWMVRALDSPNIYLYIGLFENNKIGFSRFDFDKKRQQSEISVNLNPIFRKKKLAKVFLKESIKNFLKEKNMPIIAKIKKINKTSIYLFENCGFVINAKNKNHLEYKLLL